MAMTADGKIASANRRVTRFSSRRDHDHLLELRATADAVMNGARTVDTQAISMGPGPLRYRRRRLRRGLAEFNLRVIVSGSGSLNVEAEVFQHTFSPIIVLTTERCPARQLVRLRRVAQEVRVGGGHEIDFPAAFEWLRREWNVKRLLCEGGGELNDALFRANLVDELHVTLCPVILGGRDAPTIADGQGVEGLAGAARFRLMSRRRIGDEFFLVYRRAADRTIKP